MTYDRMLFTSFQEVEPFDVGMGNNSSVKAVGHGTIGVSIVVNGKVRNAYLENVAYVPKLRYNLISVSVMEKNGMKIEFNNGECDISKSNKVVAQGFRHNGLYRLRTKCEEQFHEQSSALIADLPLWHARLAHVHVEGIKSMIRKGAVTGIDTDLKQDVGICESCVYGKSCRAPIPKQGEEHAPQDSDGHDAGRHFVCQHRSRPRAIDGHGGPEGKLHLDHLAW